VVEPVIEVGVGGEVRRIAPWLWVNDLLDGSQSDLTRLADQALAPRAAAVAERREPPPEAASPARAAAGDAGATGEEKEPEKIKETDLLDELADPGLR
jgi:hypothetical protein